MSRRLLVALVLPVVLVGCGGDPEPRVAPTPSSSPSVSPPPESPTPEPETAEGAVRAWLQLEVEMQNSGNADAYRFATAGCDTCMRFADQIEGYYNAGGYVRTAEQDVTSIVLLAENDKRSTYEVRVDPEPTSYKVSSASAVEQLDGVPLTFKVTLRRVGGRWAVADYVQLAQ